MCWKLRSSVTGSLDAVSVAGCLGYDVLAIPPREREI